ncbi:MAG: PLP-dependent cysteine synthase family protein [Longimicrobiales bacterium]
MLDAIGNTPLVRLSRVPGPRAAEVWIKLEGGNPTGSYKDRMALAMVEAAEHRGALGKGVSLLECTGGSTGSSVAFVAAVKGYPFTVVSSDAYAREKLDSMRAFGAEVLVEPSLGGVVTPDLWPRMMERARRLVDAGGYLYLDQFHNVDAHAGYRRMGQEMIEQYDGPIDAVCGAVGTGGMIMGVGAVLREAWPGVRVVALEPDSSPVLSGGEPGAHGIDGTGAGFVPPLLDREVVNEVMALPEQQARVMSRRLAREEGIFAGTSTGLNVIGALRLAREMGPGSRIVTVACDTGFKYLDGPLYRE